MKDRCAQERGEREREKESQFSPGHIIQVLASKKRGRKEEEEETDCVCSVAGFESSALVFVKFVIQFLLSTFSIWS